MTYTLTVTSGGKIVYTKTADGTDRGVDFEWMETVAFPPDSVITVEGADGRSHTFHEADRPLAVTFGMVTSVDWNVTE